MPASGFPYPKAPAPSVKNEQAHAEHGVQLGLIRAALTALREGGEGSGRIIEQLHGYTEMHFMSEALLMRMSARSDYEAHLAEHDRFLDDLEAIRELAAGGDAAAAEARLQAHERQILDHICSWDRSI